jgi:hypothetical protein
MVLAHLDKVSLIASLTTRARINLRYVLSLPYQAQSLSSLDSRQLGNEGGLTNDDTTEPHLQPQRSSRRRSDQEVQQDGGEHKVLDFLAEERDR